MSPAFKPHRKRLDSVLVGVSLFMAGYCFWKASSPLALNPFIFRTSVAAILASVPIGITLGVVPKYRKWLFMGPVLFVAGIVGVYTSAFFLDTGNEFMDRAARRGITPWLVQLLDSEHHGPDVVDSHGNSLLMKAAQYGHTDTVVELLRRGARTNYRDGDGDTALTVAERYGHTEIARRLREAGAHR